MWRLCFNLRSLLFTLPLLFFMNASETSLLESGQRVGLATADFTKELADFGPLAAANTDRAELVTAIVAKQATQDTETEGSTTTKTEARDKMARAAATLSARAVGYALATNQLGLKQEFTLTYWDVNEGDATEDVNHVRALAAKVLALPAAVRKNFRLTDALVTAVTDAANAFVQAEDIQTTTKAAPRLATLALPELLTRLSAALRLMGTLLKGVSTDADPNFRWADFYAAFVEANKRRKVAARRRVDNTVPRIVRTLPLTLPDGQARRVGNTNYGPAYTLTVENRSGNALRLGMTQADGVLVTPGRCPAGETTVLTRADIGPETARYLVAQFEGDGGGSATVRVRKVVESAQQ